MSIESLKEQARRHEQKEEWLKALDQYKKAIAQLEKEDQPDIGLYNRVGDLFVRVGNLEEAVSHYNRAADLYVEAELPNNAIAVCKKVIRNVPDRHEAYLRMGQIRAKQGFLSDARTNFLTYAERMQKDGDLDESFRALVEFCDLAPDDVDVRIAVAEQMASHKRADEAVEQLSLAYRVLSSSGDFRASEVEARIRVLDPDADLGAPAGVAGAGAAGSFTAGSTLSAGGEIEAAFGEIEIGGADKKEEPAEEPAAEEFPSFEISPPAEEEAAPLPTFGFEEEEAAPLPTFGLEEEEAAPLPTFGFEEEEAAPLPTFGFEEEEAAPLPTFGFEEEEAPPLPTFGFEEEAAPLPTFGLEEEEAAPLPTFGFEEEAAPAAPGGRPAEAIERAMEEAAAAARREPEPVRPRDEPTVEGVRSAIAGHPDDVQLRQRMVELAYQSGDERIMVEAFLGLGDTLQRTGQGARAKAAYQQVLQFEPENAAAKAALGQAPVASKPVREVAAHQDYVDLGALILGDAEEKTTRFTVAYEEPTGDDQADFARMLSQFKEKVSQNLGADDVRAHYDLGTAYKEMGLLDEAVAEFQQALRASSSHLPTYEVLGQTFIEMGKTEAAVRTLERALEAPFEIEDELIAIYYYLGRAYETQGNREGAVEFYDRVFSLDINFADVTERLRALR
ncbi:MAG TPA: tetratricopeptide repeat protein [Longimicrobiales bacterium]|nr:tetratricopeptide repeat protein [Longimicrobiales bacterium]